MTSSRIIAVLLAGFVLTALGGDPCDVPEVKPTKTPGLTDAQIAGIAVGTVAGAGVIAGGIAGGVAASRNKVPAADKAEAKAFLARESEVGAVQGVTVHTAQALPVPVAVSVTTTLTMTPLDSSASSNSGSGQSLQSLGSASSNSLDGASASSASMGFNASGSYGSYLPIWLWLVLLACCCCLAAVGGAMKVGGSKKRSKKKSKVKPAAPEPSTEVEALVAEIPPLMPSLLQPSYSLMAAPVATYPAYQQTVAAPAMTTYQQAVAAPAMTAYEPGPRIAMAAPQGYAYGTAAYAAPAAYAYSAPGAGYMVQEATTGQFF